MTDINEVLRVAACHGNIAKMREARKAGATDFNTALVWAACNNHTDTMCFLKKWGANAFKAAMRSAASAGKVMAMILVFSWDETTAEEALLCASSGGGGHPLSMELARIWGAKDYKNALSAARFGKADAAIPLLEKWIRESQAA